MEPARGISSCGGRRPDSVSPRHRRECAHTAGLGPGQGQPGDLGSLHRASSLGFSDVRLPALPEDGSQPGHVPIGRKLNYY